MIGGMSLHNPERHIENVSQEPNKGGGFGSWFLSRRARARTSTANALSDSNETPVMSLDLRILHAVSGEHLSSDEIRIAVSPDAKESKTFDSRIEFFLSKGTLESFLGDKEQEDGSKRPVRKYRLTQSGRNAYTNRLRIETEKK
jgi:hypothetical protein